MFVYLPYTSHFRHFQSVRQKKWNIHNKTNKYRWYFRLKPHQTTSLIGIIGSIHVKLKKFKRGRSPSLHLAKGRFCVKPFRDINFVHQDLTLTMTSILKVAKFGLCWRLGHFFFHVCVFQLLFVSLCCICIGVSSVWLGQIACQHGMLTPPDTRPILFHDDSSLFPNVQI